jgi:subtilisin family serine protease
MPSTAIPDRYIVLLKDDVTSTPTQLLDEHGLQTNALFERIRGFASQLSRIQVEKLRHDPRVAVVEQDQAVYAFSIERQTMPPFPTFPGFPKFPSFPGTSSSSASMSSSSSSSSSSAPPASSSQSASSSLSAIAAPSPQPVPTGVQRIETPLSATANINGMDEQPDVDIAVIDTGVSRMHSELRLFQSVNFSTDVSTDDLNGHGSHVAGTAAAKDNTAGVVGVAPGARIWSVKVLNRQGSGYMSDIIAGVDYVTQNADRIEVANMSLGCQCTSQALDTAIARSVAAGVVYVVAAGNASKDASTFSPANNPNVITVSAVADFNGLQGGGAKSTCRKDTDDTFADFSNFGEDIDIAAPGGCIYSTWKNNGYSTISGTSMASPHVAGAVALYLLNHPKPTNATDVATVRSAIIAAGSSQAGPNGFAGDPDAYHEPLLNAAGL